MSDSIKMIPVPSLFYASDTGRPFERCIDCDRPLLEDGAQYLIEKAVRRFEEYDLEEVVFEYAMCMSCYMELHETFSETSRRRMEAYIEQHTDLEARQRRLLESSEAATDLQPWTSTCLVSGAPAASLSEFQLVAHCAGPHLVLSHLPCLISGAVVDELAHLLSNETLDQLNGFMDRFFGLPPELRKPLGDPVVFVV